MVEYRTKRGAESSKDFALSPDLIEQLEKKSSLALNSFADAVIDEMMIDNLDTPVESSRTETLTIDKRKPNPSNIFTNKDLIDGLRTRVKGKPEVLRI